MAQPLVLRSPKYDRESISVPSEAADLEKVFSGTICSRKGDEYEIRENIIDLLGKHYEKKSLAQYSNEWFLTASLYEDYWRKNAVSLLSGQDFPLEKEKQLLHQWMPARSDKWYLDIGCSTALYARFMASQTKSANVVALDYSMNMLHKAREKARQEQLSFYLLRADAQAMPFFQSTFDGLLCGGTLNELTDPVKVLYEARRILKKDGTLFLMHLLQGKTWYERLLQESSKLGGLSFWNIKQSNNMFHQTGFEVDEQETYGWVCFSRLKAV
ncbi:MAG TPA: class I SAM-dependent methyltransferase [Balneolales bacterium]|nr:class I SAM-dependent methyltransferase [Balneolales bacterium]